MDNHIDIWRTLIEKSVPMKFVDIVQENHLEKCAGRMELFHKLERAGAIEKLPHKRYSAFDICGDKDKTAVLIELRVLRRRSSVKFVADAVRMSVEKTQVILEWLVENDFADYVKDRHGVKYCAAYTEDWDDFEEAV